MTKKKKCIICSIDFVSSSNNQKNCSNKCRIVYGKLKTKIAYENAKKNSRKTAICLTCKTQFTYHYRKNRGDRQFCGRSCASKYYVKVGTYDKWKNTKIPKTGKLLPCNECQALTYRTQRQQKQKQKFRFCNLQCKGKYFGKLYTGIGNPMFGRKLSKESLKKQKETLSKNYPGITNAYELATHQTKSKSQIIIYDWVKSAYPNLNFQIEKQVIINELQKRYVDIVSFTNNIAIEFMGDFWHCNPQFYEATFNHPVKNLTAKQIWALDKIRDAEIQSLGFKVIYIWESDYNHNRWQENLIQILSEEHEKEKDINAL